MKLARPNKGKNEQDLRGGYFTQSKRLFLILPVRVVRFISYNLGGYIS